MKYQITLAAIALLGQANCVNIRREPLLSWSPTPAETDHPVNYFVPHFGTDPDMTETTKSISTAEKQEEHEWVWKKQHLLDHLSNPVPPGSLPEVQRLDDDMMGTLKHADDAEVSTGQHWTGDGQYP